MKKLSKIFFLGFLAIALFYSCKKDQSISSVSSGTTIGQKTRGILPPGNPYNPYLDSYTYTSCNVLNIVPSTGSGMFYMTSTGTGLTINSTTGNITGTPSATQTCTVSLMYYGVRDTTTLTVVVQQPISYPAVFTAGTGYYNTNVYNQGATVAPVYPTVAGFTPTSYSISPSLPTGFLFNTSTGEISGTATTASAPTTYTVTPAGSCVASASFTLAVGFAFTFYNTSSQLLSETFQYSNGVEYGYYPGGLSSGSTTTLWLPPGTYSHIAINAAGGYPPPTIGISFSPSGTNWRGTYGYNFTGLTISSTANSSVTVSN